LSTISKAPDGVAASESKGSYTVEAGDTFDTIARKRHGSENSAPLIRKANPGTIEPLVAGAKITVPDLPNAPQDVATTAPSDSVDEVAIEIDGKRFRFWTKVRLKLTAGAMDTVDFSAPFGADVPSFREQFVPLSYKPVNITVGGERLFSGTMMPVDPEITTQRVTVEIGAYSRPGVLGDCPASAASYPLEFNGQNLRDIANTLANPFGLSVDFPADPGAVFERVALEGDSKVLAFLIKLARQRNLLVSSTAKGALSFQSAVVPGKPVARLVQGRSPLLQITPTTNPQNYFSSVTGIQPALAGLKGAQYTVKNPRLEGVIRPFTFKLVDVAGPEIQAAVEAKAALMFASAVSYTAQVSTWRDEFGKLWKPKTTIVAHAHDAMIYNDYEFEIKDVEFDADGDSRTATLTLTPPGVFNGVIPKGLPWDAVPAQRGLKLALDARLLEEK